MNDIRIVTGKKIKPSADEVSALLGDKTHGGWEEMQPIYEKLLPGVLMRVSPKAAMAIRAPGDSEQPGQPVHLYAMLTIGGGAEKLAAAYAKRNDLLRAMVVDAMADSCLFSFERQLLPVIRQICIAEGYGIAKRLEIAQDIPAKALREIYGVLDGARTLGISMTSGDMMSPAKSMCLVFCLTQDTSLCRIEHDCTRCEKKDCSMRREEHVLLRVQTEDASGEICSRIQEIRAKAGSNLLHVLRRQGVVLPSYCGGRGACRKCRVRLIQGCLPPSAQDREAFCEEQLREGMRLACTAVVSQDLTVSVVRQERTMAAISVEENVSGAGEPSRAYGEGGCGIAIDIGTTTLAFSLIQLKSGEVIDTCTAVNSQRSHGADVISRIQASNHGEKEQLSACIRRDLWNGIGTLIKKNSKRQEEIRHIVIAANTVMLHLLRGYSCEGFTRFPFAPVTLKQEELLASDLFGDSSFLSARAKVTLLPGISAFVGADVAAGIYASEMLQKKGASLFLDLGTNGEMALWANDRLYVASAAAGPVFEGGALQWGMPGIAGAISQVALQNGMPQIRTIGDRPPEGICGTGVIEAVSELFGAGIIDQTGKLADDYFSFGYPLAENSRGEKIVLIQKDIREIQMAKAAIRAGIEILLCRAKIGYADIARVILAGGFGYFLNVEKAAAIGILPKELGNKTKAAGNTSLQGALKYLSGSARERLRLIPEQAEEITLAQEADFEEFYINYMLF